jgi:photosystem II stability/assembly factor-like uncharacterized protein
MIKKLTSILIILSIHFYMSFSQEKLQPDSSLVNGLKFRSIGPGMASGRIADFAVNPSNPFEYYVAVASGHIWKTTNNGTSWKPVFDDYGVYAIGCLSMDPANTNVVWAGTGENNSQRALGYGNGVYKTLDGGKTWKNMGLETSRQVGKILIDPRNTDIVYVAAEGSVWGPGGDRGIYKTINGGEKWKKILEISENTGAYDLKFHPENPDIIYATTHQRRRRSFTKINGGPESAFYKSTNAGKDWEKKVSGLPNVHLGRIGLSVTPANPDYVYAIVEAADGEDGFYRSTDQGESWNRMSDYSSSGQYYTTIYADPIDPEKIYSMDTWSMISEDGGKTWKKLSHKKRHVDDHALWIDPKATDHLIIGGDGGIYESFDGGKTWKFVHNLPVTQFYRINVDNSEPFYRVYGGTQDNNTYGGPSQNLYQGGVSSDEWFITIGGDGFWVAIDPEDPNIIYSEYQYGNAYRYNHANGELVYIKPQERKDELTYKWNWDAPLILSNHSNTRLYMAANKLFVSENQGNSWKVISDDLTAQKDRNDFKVMGKFWSGDAVAKDVSTSQYGTLVSLSESPVKKGMLFTGSDDGVIHFTENNGETWSRAVECPGVPKYTYVSDIFASRFDENVVYATFNNLKSNDFKPYVFRSNDKGKSWTSISSNLPEGSVHTISQDTKDPNMLFCGTEFGIFVSFNNGDKWIQIKNGIPDISVRDIVIQERENDLVLATFGRGFYILHDYNALREINSVEAQSDAHIFSIKDAKLYIPRYKRRSSFGDDFFMIDNLPYGAEFTFWLKDDFKTEKEKRQEKDAELFEQGDKIKVNTWEDDRLEKLEESPYLLFVIEDAEGNTIRKIPAKAEKGINRIYWDLHYEDITPVKNTLKEFDPMKEKEGGFYTMPGTYQVSIWASKKGILKPFSEKVSFEVKALESSNFNDADRSKTVNYQKEVTKLSSAILKADQQLTQNKNSIQQLKQSNFRSGNLSVEINEQLARLERENADLIFKLKGYSAKASSEEIPPSPKTLYSRYYFLIESLTSSSEPVNEGQLQTLEILKYEFGELMTDLEKITNEIEEMKQ